MNFEIVGVSPANKGAVLMLEAIRDRLGAEFPGARFALPIGWPVEERLANRVWATPATAAYRPTLVKAFEYAPERLRKAVGFLASRDIDVLLDASGFGYGDVWGLPKLQNRLTKRLKRWKTGARKAIILPQALGPFEAPGMAAAFREALTNVDLAFVRDKASLGYVEAAAPGAANVRYAPDFTNLLHPELPGRLEPLRGKAAVIPNEKMVSGKPPETRARYLAFLKAAMMALRAAGHDVYILVHEGAPDQQLARELNASLDQPAIIVDEPSALVTKAVIGAAGLIVSSRFHGLVSALSAGTPALACGWSHKYGELLADYGCPQHSISLDDQDRWAASLAAFLADASSDAFRQKLAAAADAQRARSEAMWDEVIAVIRGG